MTLLIFGTQPKSLPAAGHWRQLKFVIWRNFPKNKKHIIPTGFEAILVSLYYKHFAPLGLCCNSLFMNSLIPTQ